MADKTITSTYATAATIATAGTVAAGTITVLFDDADDSTLVVENIEKAKVLYLTYMADKA